MGGISPNTSTTTTTTTTTTTRTTTTTEPPKTTTTEAPKLQNNCACFSRLEYEVEQLRKKATLTCLEDKTRTTRKGQKLIYVSAECGERKLKSKKIVCKKIHPKGVLWVPKKNPFKKII